MKKIPAIIILILILPLTALAEGYHDLGRKYFIRKNYEKAREMFLKRVEISEHGDSYYFLGEIEKIEKNFTESEEYYRKAAALGNTTKKYRKNAYWNIMIYLEERGDYSAVVRICKEMWENLHDDGAKHKIETIINHYLWSDNKEATELFNQGRDSREHGKKEEALNLFREALSYDSSFLAPKFEIGMHYYREGDIDNASYYLSDIAYRIPFYAEVQLLMGNIQFKKKYYSAAINYYDRAQEFGMHSSSTRYQIYLKRATSYYNTAYYDNAAADLKEARRLRPRSMDVLLLLSAINIKKQDYDSALETLHRAEKIRPNSRSILFQIGSIYYKKNDWRYLSYFDRLFSLAKKNNETEKYRKVLPIMARGHFEKNNYQKTKHVIAAMPENMITYDLRLLLAKSLYYTREYDKAVDEFEKLSLGTEDKILLGRAYALSGRKEKALEIITGLSYYQEIYDQARKDSVLGPIIKAMEEEKRKEEERLKAEEERRIAEEQKRLEQERLEREKAEQERLRRQEELRQQQAAEQQKSSPGSDSPGTAQNQESGTVEEPTQQESTPEGAHQD